MIKRFFQNAADYIRETDMILLVTCLISSLYGCALIFSATHSGGSYQQVIVQLAATLLGLVVAIGVSFFDYGKLSRLWPVFIAGGILLILVTFVFGYAPDQTSNKAWLRLPGGMSLQISELIKIIMIMVFSVHVTSIRRDEINKVHNVILLFLHSMTAPALIMVFQRDLGTVTVMIVIAVLMLFASGIKLRWFALGGAAIAAAAPVIWFFGLDDYQRNRFSIIFNLESDPLGDGYQQLQGLRALGSGGILGQGYLQGAKTQTEGVPKAYNDFILTVAGEELGLIGCLAVFILIIILLYRIIRAARLSRDFQGTVICTGVFGMFAAQLLINTGMVLAVLPVIGVTLPFFSAGGSSLVCLYISIGLVLSVYKHRNTRVIYLSDKKAGW